MRGMQELKGIPVVREAVSPRSGEKYVTPQGFSAIRDGIRPRGEAPGAGLRKPPWLKARAPAGGGYASVRALVREHRLATVCEEAKCPNIGECWNAGTATLMLMGAVCTRACRFCSVDTGNPRGWLDAEEPQNAARTVELNPIAGASSAGVAPADLTVFGADALFSGINASGQTGLWITDGTAGGTHELAGIGAAASAGVQPTDLTVFNGEALFAGFAALMILMVLVTYHDIVRLVSGRGAL